MKFTKVYPYGPDTYVYWVSGIYKIVSYRPGEYHSYFIQEWCDNWGDRVETLPESQDYYKRRVDAERACRRHAKDYTPSKRVVKRAGELLASFRASEIEYTKVSA